MAHRVLARVRSSLLAGALATISLVLAPAIAGFATPAQAQDRVTISAEFRTVLQPHGRFQNHSRWGEVWIPANRPRDWRPYTVGRWVYTEEWGWYWIEDQPEAAWGLVAFHYGRWVYDDELRWVWVAGNEWGPGWVQWRRGRGERRDYVGWAPMAPEGVAVEYVEKPEVWVFVRGRNFTAPRIAAVVVPQREVTVVMRETVLVNRTVVVRDRIAVNPGIPPAVIAVAVGRPIRAYEVRPRVIAGTVQLPNAVVIRPDELRRNPRAAARIEVRETRTEIRPSQQVPDPQPLGANERGRLGDNPPRAAQSGPGQTPSGQAPSGQAPSVQQQGQDATKQQQGQDAAKQQQGQDAAKQQQGQDAVKQQQGQSPSQQKQDSARDAAQQKQDAAKQKQDAAKQKQDAAKQKQDAARESAKQKQDAARESAKQKQDAARESAKQKQDAAKQKQDDARDAAKSKQPSVGSDSAKQKQDPKGTESSRDQRQPQPKQEGKGAGDGQPKQAAPSQPQNRTEGRGEGQQKGQGAPKAKQDEPKGKQGEPKGKQGEPKGKQDDAPPSRLGAPPQQ